MFRYGGVESGNVAIFHWNSIFGGMLLEHHFPVA